jgi:uncharacterized protein YuzE
MISQRYDTQADALYIELDNRDVARTLEIDPGTLVDLDDAGNLLGIEVIHPQRQWPLSEIIDRFSISAADVRELRAYFPMPARTRLPPKPVDAGLRVAING